MSVIRYRGKAGPVFWPTCDGCKRQLAPETCWADARNALSDANWSFAHDAETGKWSHFCPVCTAVEQEEAGD